MISCQKLKYRGCTFGIRIYFENSSDYLCVDTNIENLSIVKEMFKDEGGIYWVEDADIFLDDGVYKTLTNEENYAIEVEDKSLLRLMLTVEKGIGNSVWVDLSVGDRNLSQDKKFRDFIIKWYIIGGSIKSGINICREDDHVKLGVDKNNSSKITDVLRLLEKLNKKFNKEDSLLFVVKHVSQEEQNEYLFDIEGFLKDEPIESKDSS